jgi:hypothetical protein
MNDFLSASGQFFLKKLLNILVVLNEFYYHLKLLYLFLTHPVLLLKRTTKQDFE